jgi:glutamate dehydrogenase/leucine dehydrogenase
MTSSFYSSVNQYVDRASALLDLDDDTRLLLADPYRQVDMQVPIHADDGSVQTFRGFRVQHNGARGPFKGASAITPTPTSTR